MLRVSSAVNRAGIFRQCRAPSHSRFQRTTTMGVTKEVITPGDGVTFPKQGQTCVMHYTGTLMDGSKFDSSRDRGKTFQFTIGVGQVIKGWDEGVMKMSKGERANLTCTPDYAYGERGHPPVIPPSSTLIFDVELIDLK